MKKEINLDNILDYTAIYKSIVKKAKISRDQLLGLCPVHDEKIPSFSVNLKTGVCKCFSCNFQGNFVSLYARLHNLETAEAFKEICNEYNIDLHDEEKEETKETEIKQEYTLEVYANEKKLPIDFLKNFFNLENVNFRNKNTSVKMPYYGINKELKATRYRHDPKADPRFTWQKGSKTCLYGLQFFESFHEDKYVILCEGESDTQTLTYLGFNALGVPGASTFQEEDVKALEDLKIYIHVENDQGGQVFLHKNLDVLRKAGFKNKVYKFSCIDKGAKDPSALYLKNEANKTAEDIQDLIDNAEEINLSEEIALEVEESIKGAPINLIIPNDYLVNDDGVFLETKEGLSLIIKTPILIAKRLISKESEEEKIQVLFKRDNRFIGGVFDRKIIFNSSTILELTALGATISSSNAKNVVNYLLKLEEANFTNIPVGYSSSSLGWVDEENFLPYHANNTSLDVHSSLIKWASSIYEKGTLEQWVNFIDPLRSQYRFRFILAGAFSAPLLKILKLRSFIIYNWGSSQGGKTAALKSALSVFGDPDKMMVTFNGTQNSIEKMASLFCDLPLGIDERQQASTNQEGLETLFYMIANGMSKGRGTRDGGIQKIKTWRTVALTTGEEPIAKSNTQTGLSSRCIEIVGVPFESQELATQTYNNISECFGSAGKAFLNFLIKKENQNEVIKLYEEVKQKVNILLQGKNGSHIAALSAVATADIISSVEIFKQDKQESTTKAIEMLKKVVEEMEGEALPDVNISAVSYLLDYYNSNEKRAFSEDIYGTRFGWGESSSILWIPSQFKQALEEGGFSYRKTIKFMKDNNLVQVDKNGCHAVVIWKGVKSIRCIKMLKKPCEGLFNSQVVDEDESEKEEMPF